LLLKWRWYVHGFMLLSFFNDTKGIVIRALI
jgi:hypothetical protein